MLCKKKNNKRNISSHSCTLLSTRQCQREISMEFSSSFPISNRSISFSLARSLSRSYSLTRSISSVRQTCFVYYSNEFTSIHIYHAISFPASQLNGLFSLLFFSFYDYDQNSWFFRQLHRGNALVEHHNKFYCFFFFECVEKEFFRCFSFFEHIFCDCL